jgi:hypothetical protein
MIEVPESTIHGRFKHGKGTRKEMHEKDANEKNTLAVYPNGEGYFKKYLPDGLQTMEKLDSARIKVGDKTIVVHAESVNFEGTGLFIILDRMAKEIRELRSMVRESRKAGSD